MPDPIARLNEALAGRYRIERRLGEGGMATVYLARDEKHNRNVALKVLKPELAAVVGAERFLAEIETTANLQHPHILPLFDSGEADTHLFYVMPFIEGETLRDRIDREKQLPVDDAVQIAKSVAEALDYAHKRGVIHRDVKPANILLQAGKPVIADFGIALAVGVAGGRRLTETGLSLGTPHYMSPEQATGDLSVGASTDVYALGCVLYEMLVGEPPYTGSTAQAILGKIIAGELASAAKHRRSVPPNVDGAIRKALEKVPADRFLHAQGFSEALDDPGFRHGLEGLTSVSAAGGQLTPLAIGLGGLAMVLGVVAGWSLLGTEPPRVQRFDVSVSGPEARIGNDIYVDIAVAPDGQSFVYVGVAPNDGRQLWVRSLSDLDPVPIPGTEEARHPVFSPDGTEVAFHTIETVKRVSLVTGEVGTVTRRRTRHLAWGTDGTLYFSSGDLIHRVAPTGGEPEAVTLPTDGIQVLPDALPDGRGLLLTVRQSTSVANIAVTGSEGGAVRELFPGTMARYAASGHIVYTKSDGTLNAVQFDMGTLEAVGEHVELLEGVDVSGAADAQFALSRAGTLLYGTETDATWDLAWVSRTGEVQGIDATWVGDFRSPSLSPDGAQLAVQYRENERAPYDIWIQQLADGSRQRLDVSQSSDVDPAWTWDGRSVAFSSDRAGGVGGRDLWTKRADGTGQAVLQLDHPERDVHNSVWSRDGQWLVYSTDLNSGVTLGDIFAIRPGQDTPPQELVTTEGHDRNPSLSPDGRWLLSVTLELRPQTQAIYVRPFPNVDGGQFAVSNGFGWEPLWSRDGREIFYRDVQSNMVVATVETDPTFSVVSTTSLSWGAEYRNSAHSVEYDVTQDGTRFLMIRMVSPATSELFLVQNFFQELRERVGD